MLSFRFLKYKFKHHEKISVICFSNSNDYCYEL